MNIFFFKWIKEKWNIRTLHGQWLGFSSNKQVNYKAKKLALQLLKWYRYAGKKKSTKVTHFILICCHQSIKLKSLKNMHIHPNYNEKLKIQRTIKYATRTSLYTIGLAICFGEDKAELLLSTPLSSNFPSSLSSIPTTVSMEYQQNVAQTKKCTIGVNEKVN